MDVDTKARENRLRRKAQLFGLRLERSRRRDADAPDFGTYRLIHENTELVYMSGAWGRYGLTLDQVAEALGAFNDLDRVS